MVGHLVQFQPLGASSSQLRSLLISGLLRQHSSYRAATFPLSWYLRPSASSGFCSWPPVWCLLVSTLCHLREGEDLAGPVGHGVGPVGRTFPSAHFSAGGTWNQGVMVAAQHNEFSKTH